jgi:hypothetical protein
MLEFLSAHSMVQNVLLQYDFPSSHFVTQESDHLDKHMVLRETRSDSQTTRLNGSWDTSNIIKIWVNGREYNVRIFRVVQQQAKYDIIWTQRNFFHMRWYKMGIVNLKL